VQRLGDVEWRPLVGVAVQEQGWDGDVGEHVPEIGLGKRPRHHPHAHRPHLRHDLFELGHPLHWHCVGDQAGHGLDLDAAFQPVRPA
jgi:hypothetical protein